MSTPWKVGDLVRSEPLQRLFDAAFNTDKKKAKALAARVCLLFGKMGFFHMKAIHTVNAPFFDVCQKQRLKLEQDFNTLSQGNTINIPETSYFSLPTGQERSLHYFCHIVKFQQLSWMASLRFRDSSIVKTAENQLKSKELELITCLYSLFQKEEKISLSTAELKELKSFLLSRVSLIDEKGNVSWEGMLTEWLKTLDPQKPFYKRASVLFESLKELSLFETAKKESPITFESISKANEEKPFQEFVIEKSIEVLNARLALAPVAEITTALRKLFLPDDMMRRFLLFYVDEFFAKRERKTLHSTCPSLFTYALDFLFSLLDAGFDIKKIGPSWHPLLLFFFADVDVRQSFLATDSKRYVDAIYFLYEMETVHNFQIPKDKKLFFVLNMTPEIKNLFFEYSIQRSSYNPYLRLQIAAKGYRPHPCLTSTGAEEPYLRAVEWLATKPECYHTFVELQKRFSLPLTAPEDIIALFASEPIAGKFTDQVVDTCEKTFAYLKAHPLSNFQLLAIAFEIVSENATGTLTILEHIAFLQEAQEFLGHPLPWQIAFSCLLSHSIPRKFEEFFKTLEGIRQKPLDVATCHFVEDHTLELATESSMNTKKLEDFYPDYMFALIVMCKLCLYSLKREGEEIILPPHFFPLSPPYPEDKEAALFQTAYPFFPEYSRAYSYFWEPVEDGYMYQLLLCRSPLHLDTKIIREKLELSKAELQELISGDASGFSLLKGIFGFLTKEIFALNPEHTNLPSFIASLIKSNYQIAVAWKECTQRQLRVLQKAVAFTQRLRQKVQKALHEFSTASTDNVLYQTSHGLSIVPQKELDQAKEKECYLLDSPEVFARHLKQGSTFEYSLRFFNEPDQIAVCHLEERTFIVEIASCKVRLEMHYDSCWKEETLYRLMAWQLLVAKSQAAKYLQETSFERLVNQVDDLNI